MLARFFVLALLGAPLVRGQSVQPRFEAAAIRRNTAGAGGPELITEEGGMLSVRNFSVRTLVRLGWHLREVEVLGGPAWMDSEGYDVQAKGNPSATDAQLRLMVQALLAERFQLVIHREMRELPVYAMIVGKNGPKIHESDANSRPDVKTTASRITAQKVRLSILAQLLSPMLDRPVLDRTGLDGRYDFDLQWSADGELATAKDAGARAPGALDAAGASIFTAIQEQLGLRLETQKGPAEVLVVDRVERPSEN